MSDKKWTYPPGPAGGAGQSVTWHEDGSVTVKDVDGTETHYDPKTGNATKPLPPPPQVTPPGKRQVESDGEVRVSYDNGNKRLRFIPGPPRRFKIVRSGGGIPREEEFNFVSGTRGVIQQEGGEKAVTPPTSPTPEEIEPSTHPLPAATPAPAPTPPEPKPKPSGQKKPKKAKASRRIKKKPARKAKKRPAARREKGRRSGRR